MTEVNEELVKQFLEAEGYFVRTDVKYFRDKKVTGLKGSGWSDIDILAKGKDGKAILVEVKGWHMEEFAANYFKHGSWVDELAKEEAAKVLGSDDFDTILVVPALGSRTRDEALRLAKEQGIDEVWEFGDILKKLIDHVKENVSYDNETMQTIRLLKAYGFLNLTGQNDSPPIQPKMSRGTN